MQNTTDMKTMATGLLLLFATACSVADGNGSALLSAAHERLAAGQDTSALRLLLEAESQAGPGSLRGEAAWETGRLYLRQGCGDLARDHFRRAFAEGRIDLDGYAAETATCGTEPGIRLAVQESGFRFDLLRNEHTRMERRFRLLLAVGSLFLPLLLLIYIRYRRKLRRQRSETERYLALIDGLNRSASSLLAELDSSKTNEKKLKTLLENRFAEVRGLADVVYRFEHNPVLLHRKLRETLSLRTMNPNVFADLEEVVNAKGNNLIGRIRRDYPSLTENEIQFCALLAAGFSVQELCILLNIQSVQYVWMKKYRLKRKLGLPPGMDVDSFLHMESQVESPDRKEDRPTKDNQGDRQLP